MALPPVGIDTKLKIKYGLPRAPTLLEVTRWVETTEVLIRQGVQPDEAGHRAAVEVFPGVDTCAYFSEADTIASLLAHAKAK
jgi:hypothetical protein